MHRTALMVYARQDLKTIFRFRFGLYAAVD